MIIATNWRRRDRGRHEGEMRRRDDDLIGCDLLLQFGERPIGVGGDRFRFGDREMLEREAVAGAALLQANCRTQAMVKLFSPIARLRVEAFGGRETADLLHARVRAAGRDRRPAAPT